MYPFDGEQLSKGTKRDESLASQSFNFKNKYKLRKSCLYLCTCIQDYE